MMSILSGNGTEKNCILENNMKSPIYIAEQ